MARLRAAPDPIDAAGDCETITESISPREGALRPPKVRRDPSIVMQPH